MKGMLPMLSRKIILSAVVAALAMAPSIASAATNLISNGDFSLGFSGFSTQYSIQPDSTDKLYPEGTITVGGQPKVVNHFWVNLPDPSNAMLLVNGAPTGNLSIWREDTINVISGRQYNFSADVMDVCCNVSFKGLKSASSIIFQISTDGGSSWNATPLASYLTTPGVNTGVLENVTGSYLAGATGSISLRAINNITIRSGNDFALDNLSFASAVPEPGTWAMLFLGFGAIGLMMRRRSSRGLVLAA